MITMIRARPCVSLRQLPLHPRRRVLAARLGHLGHGGTALLSGIQSILAGGVRSGDEMIVETLEAVLGPGAQEAEAVVVAAADVVHGLGPGAGRGLAVVRVGGWRRPCARPAAAARPAAPGPAAPQPLAAAGQRQQRGVTREARAGAHRAQVLLAAAEGCLVSLV